MADKKKIELEYILNVSPKILYNSLSTPSGLSGWFCDDVNIRNNTFTFMWGDSDQEAEMLSKKDGSSIRFHWVDNDDDSYFEFNVKKDDITSDVLLFITDFVEDDEEEESRLLWDSQISNLKQMLGSH